MTGFENLRKTAVPLKALFFTTENTEDTLRHALLAQGRLRKPGSGWGAAVSMKAVFFTTETPFDAFHSLRASGENPGPWGRNGSGEGDG